MVPQLLAPDAFPPNPLGMVEVRQEGTDEVVPSLSQFNEGSKGKMLG